MLVVRQTPHYRIAIYWSRLCSDMRVHYSYVVLRSTQLAWICPKVIIQFRILSRSRRLTGTSEDRWSVVVMTQHAHSQPEMNIHSPRIICERNGLVKVCMISRQSVRYLKGRKGKWRTSLATPRLNCLPKCLDLRMWSRKLSIS
jgi:hypothetical protein